MRILVADDQQRDEGRLADGLRRLGHQVVAAGDGRTALKMLNDRRFDLVVCDLSTAKIGGVELVRQIKHGPGHRVPVVGLAESTNIALVVEAVKLGADDVLARPARLDNLRPILARLLRENGDGSDKNAGANDRQEDYDAADVARSVVGQTAAMSRVRRLIRICARTDANVLLSGETGVGKDLIAKVIHCNSHRRKSPFVKVGCALFPSQLIESELYGHEKGAFTGAERQRSGHFDLAENGTFYLDDIDDVPLVHQAKLLRAIEEKVFERVGGTALIKANVRIISSTKRNLIEKIADGTFREDLYYRLNVLRINLPPLRERREDIPALIEHLLVRIAGKRPCQIDPAAVDVLVQHEWPGNIRELYHTLERAYLIGVGHITVDLLRAEWEGLSEQRGAATGQPCNGTAGDFRATIERAERELLANALKASGGNKTAAAAALGMRPSTFRDKLARHALG